MASILLEVSCPVIRFEPSFLEQDDKIVRVYARAFEASSGSEPKPWHPNADAKDHTAIEACEASVAVVKDTDDALGIATATLTSFNFRSVGVELPNVDELSVSALLSKTAVVEFRLIAGATADIATDPFIGCARVPLRTILETAHLSTDKTVELNSTRPTHTSVPSLLNSRQPSTVNLRLAASNELYAFMAGGTALTLGSGMVKEAPAAWAEAQSSPTGNEKAPWTASFGFRLSLQRRAADGIDAAVAANAVAITLIRPQPIAPSPASKRPNSKETKAAIKWVADPAMPMTIFVATKNMVDLAENPSDWFFVLTLEQYYGSKEVITALAPIDTLLGLSRTLSGICEEKFSPGKATAQKSILETSKEGNEQNPTITVDAVRSAIGPSSFSGITSDSWPGLCSNKQLKQGFAIHDCLPPKRALQKNAPQRVDTSLQCELNMILSDLCTKHNAFLAAETLTKRDLDKRRRQLKADLDQETTFHSFRHRLTPQIQRAIRMWCPVRPSDLEKEELLVGECNMNTMGMTDLLPVSEKINPCGIAERHTNVSIALSRTLARAREAEANYRWHIAAAEQKNRISLIIFEPSCPTTPSEAWFEFARTMLRSQIATSNDAAKTTRRVLQMARYALDECLACENTCVADAAARLRGAVLLEEGKLCQAETSIVAQAKMHTGNCIDEALHCVIADTCSDGITAKIAVRKARNEIFLDVTDKYRTVSALQKAATYLIGFALTKSAGAVLKISDSLLAATNMQVKPESIVEERCSLHVYLIRDSFPVTGLNNWSVVGACGSTAAWKTLGDALWSSNHITAAIESYKRALARSSKGLPIDLSFKHAQCLLDTNRNSAALDAYLAAAEELQASSLWLGAGTAAIRLGNMAAAYCYLRRAIVRSPNNPQPYGFLALLDYSSEPVAAAAYVGHVLDISFKSGLDDSILLRELGNICFEHEQYSASEALLRRAIATERRKGPCAHARKRLADVLAAIRGSLRPD